MEHAKLSASGSGRWLQCPPSVALSEGIERESSSYADEGSAAHTLGEARIRLEVLGTSAEDSLKEDQLIRALQKAKASQYFDADMDRHTQAYCDYCVERINDPDTLQWGLETRFDLSKYIPESFGTCDFWFINGGTLHVVDLKYGAGVLVPVRDNSQMMIYALGALTRFDFLHDILSVSMTVYQPRMDNIDTVLMSANTLLTWAREYLSPRAKLAFEGRGELHAGSWCRWCPVGDCKARAAKQLELAKYDFKEPEQLTADEIADILGRLGEFEKWSKSIKAFALQKALAGTAYNGYKVVAGRSRRAYSDDNMVAAVLIKAGIDAYDKSVKTITELEKTLGKKMVKDLLGDLIVKPSGSPTLVTVDDNRDEWNTNTANTDFKDVAEDVSSE